MVDDITDANDTAVVAENPISVRIFQNLLMQRAAFSGLKPHWGQTVTMVKFTVATALPFRLLPLHNTWAQHWTLAVITLQVFTHASARQTALFPSWPMCGNMLPSVRAGKYPF
jgi:hypothetical protein